MSAASVQILTFVGCPNREAASELVERVAHALAVELDLELLDVPDSEAAVRLRFLGSPTIHIGGRDVEPGAEQRTDYALSCRIYRSAAGAQSQPEEAWVRDALLAQTRPAA